MDRRVTLCPRCQGTMSATSDHAVCHLCRHPELRVGLADTIDRAQQHFRAEDARKGQR